MKRSERIGLLALTLFLLPFCGAGVFLGTLTARSALQATPDWKRVALLGIGSLTFGGVGFAPFLLLRSGWSRYRRAEALKEANPGRPWMWREDWARGEARSTARSSLAPLWFMSVLWNLVSSPLLLLLPGEIAKGNRPAAFGLLFPLIGAGLLAHAFLQTLRWRKFGDSTLALASTPAAPGGRLVGAIRTGAGLRPEGGFRLALTCVRRVTSGSGKERSVSETILWRGDRTMTGSLPGDDPMRPDIPVSFEIPADAAPTRGEDSVDRILWNLSVDAELPGLDYHADFEVPVFPAPGGAAPVALGPDPMAAYEAPEEAYRPESDPGIRVGPSPEGGTEFYFAACRAPGPAFGLTVFTLIFWGSVWFLLHVGAPWIFPIVCGAFSLLMSLLALDLFIGTTRVAFAEGRVRITGGLLGLGPTRSIPCSEIEDVRTAITMQSGGRSGTPYYALKLVRRGGRTATAGEYIRDKREAEWLAAEMKKLIAAAR